MKISFEVRVRLELVAAALLFSTGGAAIKACSLGAWPLASVRSAIAAVALLCFLPEARRGWTWRAAVTGVAYASTLITFVVANKLGPAANAIFLQATAPVYLLFLGPLILKEKAGLRDLGVFGCVGTGIVLLLMGSGTGVAASAPANVVGLLSGVSWALLLVGLRWLAKTGGKMGNSGTAEASVTIGNLLACVVCLPVAGGEIVGAAEPKNAALLLYLGIFQIGLAYALVVRSVRRVSAFEAAALLLLEPVFNPIWAWLAQGEKPTPLVVAGGAAILAGALGGTAGRSAQRRAAAEV